jgi:hypothetical protein
MAQIKEQGELYNSISHAFYISGLDLAAFPQITHMNFSSVIENASHFLGPGNEFSIQPQLLTVDELGSFAVAHATVMAA